MGRFERGILEFQYISKVYGDRGQPCRDPWDGLNIFVTQPLLETRVVVFV